MSDNQKGSGVKTVTRCRICRSTALTEFFNLGNQPLANAFLRESELGQAETRYPLRVLFCQTCNLVQLGEVVDREILFSKYVYFSSGMPAAEHFRRYAQDVTTRFISSPSDLFVEIGSNDGHFLAVVRQTHPQILGVDPAQNIAKLASEKGIPTIPDFFGAEVAKEILDQHGPAKVILGNNVVAHIDNHHDLVTGVKILLSPDGVFIFEVPYLVDMFENLAFDTIYHEHLSYLALRPLIRLLAQFGMEIFDVEVHPIQGHSIRVFAARSGSREIRPSVQDLTEKELALGLDKLESYLLLAQKISDLKSEVVELLHQLKREGKKIAGYGAPAKGNTLLNYYEIGADILDYATEELPSKIGLYTPGTHIKIVHVDFARADYPDYFFLLAWNYKNKALEKEPGFLARGGRFIMPVGRERIL